MSCNKNISRGCCFTHTADSAPTVESCSGCQKMEVYDWMADTPNPLEKNDIYEIQFKNTRKGFYINSGDMPLKKGDVVVVESSPGTDIGVITMSSDLVARQMRRTGFSPDGCEFKKILRTPTVIDIERWQEAIAMEHTTMIRTRQISSSMGLDMKIGDVEYQADKMKAIFYYIADGRVDFRELIKVLAEQFRIRVEMKQIGARQEAGRIGGIAACGRELCCATWQNNFSSVSINAARVQDITPNPQKLAGQCGKLKCCLNYEMDVYLDARQSMPRVNAPLETLEANYFLVKTDVLRGLMYFSSDPKNPSIQIPLTTDRVRQIMSANRKGQKIENISQYVVAQPIVEEPAFENVVGQDSLTRFDKSKREGQQQQQRRPNNNQRTGNNNRQNRPPRSENNAAPQSENTPRENNNREGNRENNRENRPPRQPGQQNGERRQNNQQGQRNGGNRRNPDAQRNNARQQETPATNQKPTKE